MFSLLRGFIGSFAVGHSLCGISVPVYSRSKFFFAYDHGGPSPAYAWENTDGQDVLFSDGKIRSGRRGDIHLIGELYFWTGKPNEGANLAIAEMLRQHTLYKIRRQWRTRDPVSGRWSDCMKKGCADTQIWDDSNEIGSIAEMYEEPIIIDGCKHPGIRFERANSAGEGELPNIARSLVNGAGREVERVFLADTADAYGSFVVPPRLDRCQH